MASLLGLVSWLACSFITHSESTYDVCGATLDSGRAQQDKTFLGT